MEKETPRETPVGKIVSDKTVFSNPYFKVGEKGIENTPEGRDRIHYYFKRDEKNFVVVLPITRDGHFLLIKEPKYGQEKIMLTFPTGLIELGEDPKETARRELLEEAGYKVSKKNIFEIRKGIVDIPDKGSGAEHYFLLAKGCERMRKGEEGRQIVICDKNSLEALLDGMISDIKLEISMSLIGAALALRYIEGLESEE